MSSRLGDLPRFWAFGTLAFLVGSAVVAVKMKSPWPLGMVLAVQPILVQHSVPAHLD